MAATSPASKLWIAAVLLMGTAVSAKSTFPVTVTDDAGRKVTLAAAPKRIVSLSPAHTEVLFALGAGSRVVGVDSYSDFPRAAAAKPKLNCWPKPPLERIVALKPGLVVSMVQDEEFLRQMDALHVPVLKLFPTTYDRAVEEIRLLGRAVGSEAAAETLARGMADRKARVVAKLKGAPRVRVLFEMDAVDPARPYVVGGQGFYAEMLQVAGGENVFEDVKSSAVQVSAEQVLARNPEVILLGDARSPASPQRAEEVKRRPGWSGIRAVRDGRVYPVDSDRITRPGPRLAQGLEELARRLHPERFR